MDRFDLISLVGLLLVASGLYFIYPPLALLIPGIVILILGLVAGRGRRLAERAPEDKRT